MPKHYRPPGKKKEGNAARYITRSQAVKQLQVTLPTFRRLCILKGVFPREPKKKVKGNHHTYYHLKDIAFLQHDPLLEKFREIRAYEKKIKKAEAKKNKDLANRLLTRKPGYTLDRLIRERYPNFVDALRDLDDCLTMVHLFAALPSLERQKIEVKRVHNCRRLSHEWQAYISQTHKLRKAFVSVKGIYYQAEVEGQKITWLTPHALQQVLTDDIDFSVMLTFLEFYETLLSFVNFKLYHSINVKYPPILDPRLEALAADLYALSRYLHTSSGIPMVESDAVGSSGSGQPEVRQNAKDTEESELRLAQLQHQLPYNEPGALMHLVEEAADEDEEDEDTKECKKLFSNMKFFLSREVPRESLLFVIPAFGGIVSWEGDGAPFNESDQSITHQIVDRPTQGHIFLSREYLQPQWIYDCVNARIILPTEGYLVGRVPPPHLSPFADNEAEGYVPDYAETIKRLQAAARNELLPMPGVSKEDLEDPQRLVVEGIIDRTEANEAVQKKRKIMALEKQYHDELKLELEGALKVGMIFKSEEEAYDAYNLYAYRKGFGVRRGHKYFNRKGELRRCTFLCCCEGSGPELLPLEPKRLGATPRCGCQASIKFKIEDGIWEVIEFNPVHNHAFLGDEQKHLIRSSRKIAEARSDFLNSNLDIAKRVPKAHSYFLNVSKGTQTSESFLVTKSSNKIDAGDCQLLLKHMFSQQLHESNFHYSIQVDDQNMLTNFFWCDGLSRQDYECFGDVVVFDTTYRTNKYNIVCAIFFGVNHHLKSVSFGCAFLSDETAASFTWVFQTFLEAMGNEAPKTIFTGQDHAIAIAAQKAFPQTNHRLCISQIEKNSSNYIANLLAQPGFRDKCFTKFLHGCESEEELDQTWKQMCSDWDFAENKWLKDLYHLRAKWSSALMRDTFSANLEFLPRPSIFQHVSCKSMSLVELVVHYDKKVEKIRETELSTDADCARGNPRILVQESRILKHAANLYTHAVFKKFQDEFLQIITERVISSNADGPLRTYILKNEDGEREHIVNFNSSNQTISCSCKLFESKGWLCHHALCILNSKESVYYIPPQYILKRWTKCAKEGFLSSDHALNFVKSSKKLRVNRLMQKAFGIISLCADRVDTVGIAIRSLELLEAEVRAQKEALGKCLDGKMVMEEDDSDTSDSGEGNTGANSRRAAAKRKRRKTKEMIESPQSDEDPQLLRSTVPTHANFVTNTNLATNLVHPQDSTFPVNINSVPNRAFSKSANPYTSPVYTNQFMPYFNTSVSNPNSSIVSPFIRDSTDSISGFHNTPQSQQLSQDSPASFEGSSK